MLSSKSLTNRIHSNIIQENGIDLSLQNAGGSNEGDEVEFAEQCSRVIQLIKKENSLERSISDSMLLHRTCVKFLMGDQLLSTQLQNCNMVQNFSSSTSTESNLSTSAISVFTSSDESENSKPPISPSQLSLPEPPDGGYGWIIVFAAFMVHLITDGIVVSFGIFIEELVIEFDDSMSATSWVGSLSYGIPALVTPISSVFLNRFGCRLACIFGAFISSIGCLVGSFMNSLLTLTFTFGVLSGIGISLSTTAALVIVSIYFDDHRATATGLSISGTGVGALIFAPVVNAFLEIYTWRGTLLLLSGIFLNIAVFGALMRPVETRIERRHRQRLALLEHLAKESGLPSLAKSAGYLDLDVLGRIKMLRDCLLAPRLHPCSHKLINTTTRSPVSYFSRNCLPNDVEEKRMSNNHVVSHESEPPNRCAFRGIHTNTSTLEMIPECDLVCSSGHISSDCCSVHQIPLVIDSPSKFTSEPLPTEHLEITEEACIPKQLVSKKACSYSVANPNVPPSTNRGISFPISAILNDTKPTSDGFSIAQVMPTSYYEMNVKSFHPYTSSGCRNTDGAFGHAIESTDNFQSDLISEFPVRSHPQDRSHLDDILYRHSLVQALGLSHAPRCLALSLPDLNQVNRIRNRHDSISSSSSSESLYTEIRCCFRRRRNSSAGSKGSLSVESAHINSVKKYVNYYGSCTPFHTLCHWCGSLRGVRLFKRPSFVSFVISNVFLYFWYNVTFFFMGVRAVDLGMPESTAALLFSVLGGANMLGEVAVGFLADCESVDALTLYLFMVLICGISTTLVPFLKTFIPLSLYAAVFGVTLAANDALCTILLVEFVGLHRLTNGMGICFFCQGVANILGPPAIGSIIDATQSHNVSFVVSGVGLILSALSVLPIFVRRYRRRRARCLRRKSIADL